MKRRYTNFYRLQFTNQHITNQNNLPMSAVLFAMLLWIIYENGAKYKPMIQ